jgi:hypothetical protein
MLKKEKEAMATENCVNCGEEFDSAEQTPWGEFNCSYHPFSADSIGNTGPRGDYDELWVFRCCGKAHVSDKAPPKSPGCLNAFHVWKRSTIFMSYARLDRHFAGFLENELKRRGYALWKDMTDIAAGEDWQEAISEAMEACSHFIVLLSSRSIDRPEVNRELGAALQARKTIIPILLEDCEVPPQLRRFNYIDWRDGQDQVCGPNFTRLDEALGDPRRILFLERIRSGKIKAEGNSQ